MPYYQYVAKDISGKKTEGKITVENERALYGYLKGEELFCISYKEIDPNKGIGQKAMKLKALVILAKQFAAMLGAGVSIVKCFDIIYHQTQDKKLKKSLHNIYEGIQKGNTLSNALRQEGKLFPPLFISMIRAGEESGNLENIFSRLATHYDREKELKDKTINAMIYPIILSLVSIVVMIILLIYVIPNFFEMFESETSSLPASTRFLLGLSQFFRSYGIQMGAVLAAVILIIVALKDTKQMKYFKDWLMLKLPVIGKLNAIIISSRFAQTLSTLYASGLSLLESLEITQDVINHSLLNEKMDEMRDNISKGMPLWKAISQVPVFPVMLSNMIEVGEESGQLDEILEKTAVFYDQEADVALKRLIAIIEPAMIIVLGLMIGFIIAAIIPPMYSMYQNMR